MNIQIVTLGKGKAPRRAPKKKAKRSRRKPSAKRRQPKRRRRPVKQDRFASGAEIDGAKIAKYSVGQAQGAVSMMLVENEGKNLRVWDERVYDIAKQIRDAKPYGSTEAYLRFVAWAMSKERESWHRKIATGLRQADMIPRGMTKLIVEWASEVSTKRGKRNHLRSRIEGEWFDYLKVDPELRKANRRRGRVMRAASKAIDRTSFGSMWYGSARSVKVAVANEEATKKLREKIGGGLGAGAQGNLPQPGKESRSYGNTTIEIDLTLPENWWERVGSKGIEVVENRLILDARELRRKTRKGERVFIVLYLDTGAYKGGGWRYRTDASELRPNSLKNQASIRAWRGRVLVDQDGKARFDVKRDGLENEDDDPADDIDLDLVADDENDE